MYPEEIFDKLYKKHIDESIRIAFIAAVIIGLFAHGYMLANKLPNYDDIKCMVNDYGTGIESGRWMLFVMGNIVRKTIGNYSLPWFNGIISICVISVTACIITRIFDIKDKILCALTGAVVASFPALTGILFFMYTSIYYCISILMCVSAVYFVKKYKWGLIIGALLLAASIGIYQAYVSIGTALLVLVLIKECLNENEDWKNIIIMAFRFLLMLIAALVVYLICMKLFVFIKGTQLLDYQGINDMGKVNISDIPRLIKSAYADYARLLYSDMYGVNAYFVIKAGIILLHIISISFIVGVISKKQKAVAVETLLLLLLFPLAVNIIYIMAPDSYKYSIMMYSVIAVYLMAIMLMQCERAKSLSNRAIGQALQWTGTIALTLIIVFQCQFNNVQYIAMTMQYEQAYSYMTTLVTNIKGTEGYNTSMDVIFIGGEFEDPAFYRNDEFADYNFGGRSQDLVNIYSRNDFLKRYLGFKQNIVEETDVSDLWKDKEEVKKMPCYPDDGSVKVVDHAVVVKLQAD